MWPWAVDRGRRQQANQSEILISKSRLLLCSRNSTPWTNLTFPSIWAVSNSFGTNKQYMRDKQQKNTLRNKHTSRLTTDHHPGKHAETETRQDSSSNIHISKRVRRGELPGCPNQAGSPGGTGHRSENKLTLIN